MEFSLVRDIDKAIKFSFDDDVNDIEGIKEERNHLKDIADEVEGLVLRVMVTKKIKREIADVR